MNQGGSADHLARSLRNAWLNGWTQAVGLGLSIATSFLLARLSGPEALGLYSFSGGLSAVLIVVTSFATNTIVTRDIARLPSSAGRELGMALALCLLVSIPLGVLTAALVGLALGLDAVSWRVLVLFAVLQGVRNGRGVYYAAYQGLSRFETILAIEMLCLVATLALGAFVLAQGGGVAGFVVACLLVELPLLAIAHGHFLARVGPVELGLDPVRWLGLIVGGLPVALTALANTVNLRADAVMLGLFKDHREVGIYSAAFTGYLAIGMFLNSLSAGFFPALSELHGKGQSDFDRLLKTAAKLIALGGLGLGLSCALLARPALLIVYGAGFEAGWTALVILSFGAPFVGLQRLFGTSLTAVGRPALGLRAAGLGATCHVLVNLVAIPRLGMNGAASATVAGECVACLAALVLLSRTRRGLAATPPSGDAA